MKEIKNNYPMEWEYKALTEVKKSLIAIWGRDRATWTNLRKINKEAIDLLRSDATLQLRPFIFPFTKEFSDFLNSATEIILFDPFITRIFFYVHTLPEDIHIRNLLLVDEQTVNALFMFVHQKDVLEDSDLAKSILHKGKPVKAIPLCHFLVGQFLTHLFDEYDHCKMIDKVKMAGAKESVEELRKNRIYKSNEGVVYDYSPLSKKIKAHNGDVILEVFTKEDFEFHEKEASQRLDEILCSYIQKSQPDPRPTLFFGNEISDCDFTVRYKTEETKIPFRLLPKYRNLIKKIAEKYTLTKLVNEHKNKEDEIQEAMAGLFDGAKKWDKNKGATPAWFKKEIEWRLSHALENTSTETLKEERLEEEEFKYKTGNFFQKKILKEDFDSRGGSLDDPIGDEEEGESKVTLKDNMKTDTLTPEECLIDKEKEAEQTKLIQENPNILVIYTKKMKGEPTTHTERKQLERFRKKHSKPFKK